MAQQLTTNERMKRVFEHRTGDRAPIVDSPWSPTIKRWRAEGMPEGVEWEDFFGADKVVQIGVDNSPRYPEKTLKETDDYVIGTTRWGVTRRTWKNIGGVPEFLDFTIVDPESWAKAKARMTPSRDRIDWAGLEKNYKNWRERGVWLKALLWFGFDVTHSHTVGTERVLMAMALQPEWMVDMFNTFLDTSIALWEMVFDAGYTFDEAMWYDDMGYKHAQFFSLDMYRELLKPVHKRAADWARSKGLKVYLHSCGDVRPFVPELLDVGIEMLNPLEVKAGMDPLALKAEYGGRLAFHGGISAVNFDKPEKMWEEMRRVVPAMKKSGGYVIGSDHSVPNSVGLEEFREFVRLAKELGRYD